MGLIGTTIRSIEGSAGGLLLSPQRVGTRQRGIFSFSEREYPPYTPKRKDEGSPPRPPTLPVWGLKNCSACGIGCGVHGFAMNPCDSTHPATAPYYREARVTVERRQTACGMRHCFARRIVETGSRRELLRTSTRWAERQRVVGAEANRIAMLTRQSRAQAVDSASAASLRAARLQCENLSLGGFKGGYSLL